MKSGTGTQENSSSHNFFMYVYRSTYLGAKMLLWILLGHRISWYISLNISMRLIAYVHDNSQVGQEIILNNNFNIILHYK